jgi:hypothetical protein
MNFRASAEDAGWSIREAAWPLQRLIETRLTWPLGDALRKRGNGTRAAVAAGVATLALAAAAGGAMIASGQGTAAHGTLPAASVTSVPRGSDALALQGVTPQFQAGHATPAPAKPPTKASAPPAQVAWQFAQAFVGYEVGRASKKTDAAFGQTATKPLAKALAKDPPRLPAHGKVPQARVLNVVLGAAGKQQVTASVSLVRLRAMSEVRLTLTKTGNEWRVAQVLG